MSRELTPSMRRSILIAVLRDNSLWPDGFEFDYEDCQHCASGLYRALYAPGTSSFYEVGRQLGLSHDQTVDVFNGCEMRMHSLTVSGRVTPEMVANRLEQIH